MRPGAVESRSGPPPGGPSTITGITYQMLWCLLRAVQIHVCTVTVDDTRGMTHAVLRLEPRNGGDVQEVGEATRRVVQLKTRSGGGPWSLCEMVADATATAELYNPSSGTWAPTGSLQVARCRHTATLLNNGKVLVAGGCDIYGERTATAELYDPGSGSWTPTGPLNVAHAKHTATLLNNGKVLVAGGGEFPGTTSAELYDPSSGRWSLTGPLNVAWFDHTATLLPNGQELVTGGEDSSGPTASAELYDSSTDTWTLTGSMDKARSGHTATLLQNGQVLLAGGYDDPVVATAKAELFTRAGLYTFTGFFQPVDNLPILNVAKAGSAIPVKFSLHGNMGLAIMAAGSPASQPITCSATDPVDLIDQTVAASTSSLTYDPVANQYIYVWKTDKSWAGTCRQLVVTLRDGKPHYAHFTFTK